MKRILVILGIVLMLASAAAWLLLPRQHSFLTDADRIREPEQTAAPRDILWQPPLRLSDEVNSNTEDYEPRLSPDGLTLFFVRGKAGHNAEIFSSHRLPDGWSAPEPLADLNSEYDDLGPEPSADGESLYFYSDRPGGSGGYDLWLARRGSSGWQPAANLGPLVNSAFNDYGPALTPDGNALYFASNRPRPDDARQPNADAWPATLREDLYHRDYDLYSAPLTDRGAGQAEPLLALNTTSHEGAPAVSPVGDFLYFSSDRPGGQGGFDLYRSRRLRGQHQPATNLGAAVNTPANELDPGLALGGYALYFSSDRPLAVSGSAAPRDYDLYQTSSREVFREREQQRASIDWAALWSRIGPNLLWALLALLMLLLLLRMLRDARYRKLSLLARCLLLSLFAHLLLMFLFNFWQVTASVTGWLRRGGTIQIALAAPAQADAITAQIRGPLSESPSAPSITLTQLEPPLLKLTARLQPLADLQVERSRSEMRDQPQPFALAADAPSHAPVLPPSPDTASTPDPPSPANVSVPAAAAQAAGEPETPAEFAPTAPPAPVRTAFTPSRSAGAGASVNGTFAPERTMADAAQTPDAGLSARATPADAAPPPPVLLPAGLRASSADTPTAVPIPQLEETATANAGRAPVAEPSTHLAIPALPPARAALGSFGAPSTSSSTTSVALAPVQAPAAPDSSSLAPAPRAEPAPPAATPIVALPLATLAATDRSDSPPLSLRLPTEEQAPEDHYVQRAPEQRSALLERMGGSDRTEQAVSLALKWLALHQSRDGRWDGARFDERCGQCDGQTDIAADSALTGLALLCFLGAGHTQQKDGPYRDNVERGLAWLLKRQSPDGDLRVRETMYSHGIAAIALSEAYGMTRDARLTDPVRRAIAFIAAARNTESGGWRYDPGDAGDTSVTGWQVMALSSARLAKIDVPPEAFESARRWMERVSRRSRPGLYVYQPGRRVSPAMTAEGMFIQQLLGLAHDDPGAQASVDYLMQHRPTWAAEPNTYYWYYATLALFQHQGQSWRDWNAALTSQLLAHQSGAGRAAGSWDPVGPWAAQGGRIYQTALCTLMLEVYYRYLPLYSRDARQEQDAPSP